MSDWGVPDWRDEGAYPSPQDPLEVWRWEFTRRRDDYRDAWQCGDTENSIKRFGYPTLEDPRSERLVRRYGELLKIHEVETAQGIAVEAVRLAGPSMRMSDHLVKIQFDLNEPLQPQLQSAEECLSSLQRQIHGKKVTRRLHRKKWPRYLRIIDARNVGETWETIGRELLEREPESALEELPVEEYDKQIDGTGSAATAKAFQVWKQARDLMFNFPD